MLIDKIKNWLQKRGYDVHAEVSPAIDFFGVIKFSLAKVTVDHTNPDEWSEEERKAIADILKSELNASLDEFSKCLKEEIRETTKEERDSILKKIAELVTEKPLIPLKEFEKRTEIAQLLKYEKFIGRKDELEELHSSLTGDRKVLLLIGEGGTGKTRLAIEFARRIEDEIWDVYFINTNKSFRYFGAIPSSGNILLVLDDASRYPDRNKVIDFVFNPPPDSNIKLLLLDRPIFRMKIKTDLQEKEISFVDYEIKRGDIISFLKEYFEIDENTAIDIEAKCRNSFVWAAFFAVFHRDTGKVGTLMEVLKNRTAKYIRDIEIRAKGMTIEDVTNILFFLSVVTPVTWIKDKKHFKEIFEGLPQYKYADLERIVGLAGESDILLDDGKCTIKPDPVAGYLTSEFMNKKVFAMVVNGLLPYMPFRTSYNIAAIPEFKLEIEEVFTVLGNIWVKLNRIKGQTPEYFSALVLFTGNFAHLPFFDINEATMSLWIESYKDIRRAHPEKEVREHLAKGLFNATSDYGRADKFEKMEECLQELRKLHDAHPEEKEVREKLASGLFNAMSHYGRADKFEKMEECLQELRKLHDAHPEEKEVREKLASGLVNATHYLGDRDGGYENLFLLFVLRFDLPDNSNRERFIKIIEDLLIKETIKIVVDKYNEGKEHLAEFIDWMKAEIENQTEVVLLMDKISEKLDFKVQKKLWELLT